MANEIVRRLTSWELWFYGLISGFIGGGASAAITVATMATAHASGMDVPILNFKAVGIVFLSSGLINGLSYLSKSPLPPLETVTTTTNTTTLTEKTTTTATPTEPPKTS